MAENDVARQDCDRDEVNPEDFCVAFMVTRPVSRFLIETATGGIVEAQFLLLLISCLADKHREDDALGRASDDAGWARMDAEWMEHSAMMFGCEVKDFLEAADNLTQRGFIIEYKVDVATGRPNRFLLDLSGSILFLFEQLSRLDVGQSSIDEDWDDDVLASLEHVAAC